MHDRTLLGQDGRRVSMIGVVLVTPDRPNVDGCPVSDAGLANSVAIPDANPWTGSIDPEVLSDPGRGSGDFRS